MRSSINRDCQRINLTSLTDEKEFENDKNELIKLVEGFNAPALTNQPHPVFGKLTKEQWSKATWKHLDHHLRQFGV